MPGATAQVFGALLYCIIPAPEAYQDESNWLQVWASGTGLGEKMKKEGGRELTTILTPHYKQRFLNFEGHTHPRESR